MTGTGPVVWILDDHRYEADFFAEVTEKYGFETKVFTGPMEFALEIENSRELKPDIRAIVLDSHFSGVASLGSIGRPDLRFSNGHLVGEALADQYLPQFTHFDDVPKVILTSFVEHRTAEPLKAAKRGLG